MKIDLSTWGPATVLIVVGVFTVSVAGAVVCIVNPDTLSFQTYLEDIQRFLVAVAGLALARGIHLGLERNGSTNSDASVSSSTVNTSGIMPDQGDAGPSGAEVTDE